MNRFRTYLLGAFGLYLVLAGLRIIGIAVLMLPGMATVNWLYGASAIGETAIGVIVIGLASIGVYACYTISRAILWLGQFIEDQWRDHPTRK